MPGYKPQVKSESGDMVDIPIAATYDENGNRFIEQYLTAVKQTLTNEQKTQVLKNILGETPIGSLTVPIYWDGSSFRESIIPGSISLETATWAQIKQLADAGVAQKYFKIGDQKPFQLTDGTEKNAILLGFGQDEAASGQNKTGTVITFAISGTFGTSKMFDTNDVSETDYTDSLIYDLCETDYFDLIPQDLSQKILTVNKECEYYWASRNDFYMRNANLKLFPLDSYEIMGEGQNGSSQDTSKIYQLFADKSFISGWANQWCRNVTQFSGGDYYAYNITPSSSRPSGIVTGVAHNVCLAFCI